MSKSSEIFEKVSRVLNNNYNLWITKWFQLCVTNKKLNTVSSRESEMSMQKKPGNLILSLIHDTILKRVSNE